MKTTLKYTKKSYPENPCSDKKGAKKKSEIRVTFLILTEFFKSQVTCKTSQFLAHTDKQCNGKLTDIGFASLYPTNKRLY